MILCNFFWYTDESVTAENPDWQCSIPGLMMSAQDKASSNANIESYIGSLQQSLVDTINRSSEHPGNALDEMGLRQKKRRKINDTHMPLPQGRRPLWHTPSNRGNLLEYEGWFCCAFYSRQASHLRHIKITFKKKCHGFLGFP